MDHTDYFPSYLLTYVFLDRKYNRDPFSWLGDMKLLNRLCEGALAIVEQVGRSSEGSR